MTSFQRRYQENTFLLNILKYAVDIIMVICAAYVLINFGCTRAVISGSSMQPALENEDTVLVNRMAYGLIKPQRYDVIAFEPEGIKSSKVYIKRVIGLPGDRVQIIDGRVYINGERLEDDIANVDILTAGIAVNEVQLSSDEYFVLGDNRNNSEDSRFSNIGIIKKGDIVGKVWIIISPFTRFGIVG